MELGWFIALCQYTNVNISKVLFHPLNPPVANVGPALETVFLLGLANGKTGACTGTQFLQT